jgi:hypothetical protein
MDVLEFRTLSFLDPQLGQIMMVPQTVTDSLVFPNDLPTVVLQLDPQ